MSASLHGLSTLTFGAPTITGYVVQSVNTSAKANLVVEVFDENGKRVHSRYDDQTSEVTFEAVIAGATLPTPGGVFTVDGVTYEVLSVDKKKENKGYNTVSIKGKTSEGVSLP